VRFGSVCSGIEAASVAWLPLGWTCAFMSEIDAFPRAVLKHHYPDTPLHGDFTTIQAADYGPIDVLVGGTPCQSFSVAGLRGGMRDERGNLALEYLRLVDRLRPRWVVWENVPGVLSSGGGRDFGAFLGGLGECGYGWSYRVLDAQYFGLAQRRKRVFVVGCAGDWRGPAQVLAIPEGLRGHPAPRRTAGEGTPHSVAASLTGNGDAHSGFKDEYGLIANPLGAKRDGGWRGDLDNDTFVTSHEVSQPLLAKGNSSHRLDAESYVARSLNARQGRYDGESETFVTHALDAHSAGTATEDGTGRGTPLVAAFNWQSGGDCRGLDPQPVAQALTKQQTPAITGSAVRRLTPVECARLQGFPDDYLDVSFRGKPAADGNKYRALGNSMAVPVMAWIGRRIEEVSELAPTVPRRRSRNGGAMPADAQPPRRRATSSPGAGVFS
jgi:DNA (cytosine-5)-methyltransferase 1